MPRLRWQGADDVGNLFAALDGLQAGHQIERHLLSVERARRARQAGRNSVGVPFAARVRHEAGVPTQAVGLITTAGQADAIVAEGRADMVAMARAFLDDPRWVWQAARELGAEIALPPQYRRAAPPSWPGRGG